MSQKQTILQLLVTHGRVSNVELNKICFRYGARIMELRRAGFDILSERDSKNSSKWWFILQTPKDQIDWEKMRPKPGEVEQAELFAEKS